MNRKYSRFLVGLLLVMVCSNITLAQDTQQIKSKIQTYLDSLRKNPDLKYDHLYPRNGKIVLNDMQINKQKQRITFRFNKTLGNLPFRETNIAEIKDSLRNFMPDAYSEYQMKIFSGNEAVKTLIPNLFRNAHPLDDNRIPDEAPGEGPPLVSRPERPYAVEKGLKNRHLALWHSHGWYYEPELDRWEFQRARLFQTIEDIYPMSYVLPYLVPMLENAGANVLLPRERDIQTEEILVDNDKSSPRAVFNASGHDGQWKKIDTAAFAPGNPPYTDTVNPFRLGSALKLPADSGGKSFVQYIPSIPQSGEYSVYVSYVSLPNSTDKAGYTVYHSGGVSRFYVNQQMGGRTWIHLGKFHFDAGFDPDKGAVVLTNAGDSGHVVTADAVRFGGGMGNIQRNGKVSGRGRYLEAARYYMQYAGMPDSLVYMLNDSNDYVDDYQGRGEWVNYLIGDPNGPTDHRNAKGLNIPVDLSFAFHTDAGYNKADSIIGTLAIFDTKADKGLFPDSTSRMASRDFADIMQTQIVEDIRELHIQDWQRRGLWNKEYSEAYRPTVPAVLLELFSHQNFRDMQFGLSPQFRFNVSRAIYKSILKFLAFQYNTEYFVQPLPVDNFSAEITPKRNIRLSWSPVYDSLEPTAIPQQYVVYSKKGNGGYGNGRTVSDTTLLIENPAKDGLHSFYVTAANKGGQSMPSEKLTVSLGRQENPRVLVINAFDRIAAPDTVDQPTFKGFANFRDEGVPDGLSLHYTGAQYEFDPRVPWKDDDDPGFGASYANWETQPIAGNTHDLVKQHAEAFFAMQWNVASASDEAVAAGAVDLQDYDWVDIQFGEEKSTVFPGDDSTRHFQLWNKPLRKAVDEYLKGPGKIIISGAYVGTDVFELSGDTTLHEFARKRLGFFHRTNHATIRGEVNPAIPAFNGLETVPYSDTFNPRIYKCEAPDAIEPEENAVTFMRYGANNTSAAVISKERGTAVFGFPLETITDDEKRNLLFKLVIEYFGEL